MQSRKWAAVAVAGALLVLAVTAPPAMAKNHKLVFFFDKPNHLQTDHKAFTFAGKSGALSAPGPYTVFAPSDKAWSLLTPSTYSTLFGSPSLMANVVTYQVVDGRLSIKKIKNGMTVQTREGSFLTFHVSSKGKVTVNGAAITKSDAASNGDLYVIGKVLIPVA